MSRCSERMSTGKECPREREKRSQRGLYKDGVPTQRDSITWTLYWCMSPCCAPEAYPEVLHEELLRKDEYKEGVPSGEGEEVKVRTVQGWSAY